MAQFYADRVALGSKRAKTPEGYLLCLGVPFARTGIQYYREKEIKSDGADSQVSVLRQHDEVFNPATLASFEGKPITSPHPPQFITPDNWQHYAKGHVQNVRRGEKLPDGEHALIGDLLITDSDLIARIESNLITELSAGYDTEYVPDAHAPNIYKQTNIRGNHVAVVPNGRAGSSVKILDAKEETAVAETAVEDKVSISTLKSIFDWARSLGQPTVDSESEAVERNAKVNAEALRRAKMRNQDAEEEKKKKEEDVEAEKEELAKDKKAKDAKDAKDAEEEAEKEEKKEKKMADSIFKRILDAFEKKKEEEDDDEEKEKAKKEGEDSDLIPTATLSGKEVPKNPIPGADKALDHLRSIRAAIAATRDRSVIDAYNQAVTELKGGSNDAYVELLKTQKPDVVANDEKNPFGTTDAKAANDFVDMTKQYHRRNPGEASAERRTAGKE